MMTVTLQCSSCVYVQGNEMICFSYVWHEPYHACKYLTRRLKKMAVGCSQLCPQTKHSRGQKWKLKKFHLNTTDFFLLWAVNRIEIKVQEVSRIFWRSLEMFKTQLDMSLSPLLPLTILCTVGLDEAITRPAFLLQVFCHSAKTTISLTTSMVILHFE